MKPIGGYFELELPIAQQSLHPNAVRLNSGRHALEFIIRNCFSNINTIWLPYYTCDVLLQPLNRLGVKHQFYHIDNNLEIISPEYNIQKRDVVLLTNYFGIKDSYISNISKELKGNCIIDCAQALFFTPNDNIPAIFSPRKFVGIPDGGLALNSKVNADTLDLDYSWNRSLHLLKRLDAGASAGYNDFHSNSLQLANCPVKRMSNLSQSLMDSIDFSRIRKIRRQNYQVIKEVLDQSNQLSLPSLEDIECPMVYPYQTDNPYLRKHLIDNQIFVPTYWKNVTEWAGSKSLEAKLVSQIIPLPIDQRYNENDMFRILEIIHNAKQ